jgi:hypothetical protein
MNPDGNVIFVLFPIIVGAFFALNGAVLLTVWSEVKRVRDRQHDQGTDLTVQGAQIKELAKDVETIFDRLETRRHDAE